MEHKNWLFKAKNGNYVRGITYFPENVIDLMNGNDEIIYMIEKHLLSGEVLWLGHSGYTKDFSTALRFNEYQKAEIAIYENWEEEHVDCYCIIFTKGT